LLFGKEINTTLATFIENGQGKGVVRQDIIPMLTVYIFGQALKYYEELSEKYRKMIPLKKVFIPVAKAGKE